MPRNRYGAEVFKIAQRLIKRSLVEKRREIDFSRKIIDKRDPKAMPIKRIGFAKLFCEVIFHGLFQWLDFRRQPPCPKRFLTRAKFDLVYCRPHNCHFQSPPRQIAVQDLEIVNRYTDRELAIFSVKVSRG